MSASPDLVALTKVRRLCRSGAARAIRLSAGLSLAEMGRPIPVSASTIFRWEQGIRSPHGEAAVRYGEMLDRVSRES